MNKDASQKSVKPIKNGKGAYFPLTLCLSILLIGLVYAALLAASYLLTSFSFR